MIIQTEGFVIREVILEPFISKNGDFVTFGFGVWHCDIERHTYASQSHIHARWPQYRDSALREFVLYLKEEVLQMIHECTQCTVALYKELQEGPDGRLYCLECDPLEQHMIEEAEYQEQSLEYERENNH